MNVFEKFLYMLQATMNEPERYGWFHFICLVLTFLLISFLSLGNKKNNEKHLKLVLGIYGIVALILEILKQLVWSFNYDILNGIVIWDYRWYAAPFQLCTTPIYVSIMCLFLKKGKIRESLLSYMAFVTIIGGLVTMIIPDSCFVETILVNIHTMWLHCGSFLVSVYLILSDNVKINKTNLKSAYLVFLIFVLIAQILNISIYNMGILNGETFNMFYISPYFISELPVYDLIQQSVPYGLYLLVYIISIFIGSFMVYGVAKILKRYSL